MANEMLLNSLDSELGHQVWPESSDAQKSCRAGCRPSINWLNASQIAMLEVY